MVKWLAACVRHLAGRSGDKPAPPVRQVRNENPALAWEYALSVTVATQGKLCLSPLTDAERLVLFPEVLLPEKPVTHNRLPYHTCGHRPEKRCMVARLYRQEEAARSDVACVPQRLRFYPGRVAPFHLFSLPAPCACGIRRAFTLARPRKIQGWGIITASAVMLFSSSLRCGGLRRFAPPMRCRASEKRRRLKCPARP